MQDVSPELQSWTLRTSRYQLRQVLSNLNIPENELQTYIVLTTDPILQNRPNIVASEYIPAPEEVSNNFLNVRVFFPFYYSKKKTASFKHSPCFYFFWPT